MKKKLRQSDAQMNHTRQTYIQGNYHKEDYNRQRNQRYGSSDYYMYTANAVAREYQYEEERTPVKKVPKPKPKSRIALARHVSTVFLVFLMGMALVVQDTMVQSMGYQVSQNKSELKAVQSENEKIKKQIAALGELQNVEAIAINNLGMHKPNEWEVIYLPQEQAALADTAADGSIDAESEPAEAAQAEPTESAADAAENDGSELTNG